MAKTKIDLSQIKGLDRNETLKENITRIEEKSYKVIFFVISDLVKEGVQKSEIRFPFEGNLEEVYASCSDAGASDTIIELQKCSQDYIDGIVGAEDWKSVLSQNITIEANKKSSNTSTLPAVISTSKVDINDHFRLNIINAGGLRNLTVEVKIKI
jgi:hypothetical protein